MTDHRRLEPRERNELVLALRRNQRGDAILTSPQDTRFVGVSTEIPDEEVINAIKSVPTHY